MSASEQARMGTMFRWLLKINLWENPDDTNVRVYGKRCNIVHRTSAPLSAQRGTSAALPSDERTGQGVL